MNVEKYNTLEFDFHHLHDDYDYIKSRFAPDSEIMFSYDCAKEFAKMLRKIEHIDLRSLPIMCAGYRHRTSFGFHGVSDKVRIAYEEKHAFGNPILFAYVMAHEIRHYVQYKNKMLNISGFQYIFCEKTNVRFHPYYDIDKGLDFYTSLPWEADANYYAAQLVDVDNTGIVDIYNGDEFFAISRKNRQKYYDF